MDRNKGGVVRSDFTTNKNELDLDLSTFPYSDDGIKIRDTPNGGGSSVNSEATSFEILKKCAHADLIKTEMEVKYFPEGGPMTDYVCEIYGIKLGVSVTRAMNYEGRAFTEKDAEWLLEKKLKGVIQSSENSLENWQKQVLHIWCKNDDDANNLDKVFNMLPTELKRNTVVLITTTLTPLIYNTNVN